MSFLGSSPLCFLRLGLLWNPELSVQLNWILSPRDPPVPASQTPGLQVHGPYLALLVFFYMGSEDLSGPQTCKASILLTGYIGCFFCCCDKIP